MKRQFWGWLIRLISKMFLMMPGVITICSSGKKPKNTARMRVLVLIWTIGMVGLPLWVVTNSTAAQPPEPSIFVEEQLTKRVPSAIAPPKQNGMAYVTWSTNGYTDEAAEQSLSQLRSLGTNWISLLVTQYQHQITSTNIYPIAQTPTDAALAYAINQAHRLGFQVMLKPHLDLANDPHHWRGQIGQDFTETQWEEWFNAYQTMINHYAQLAQTYGADQFTVGTELQATEGQEGRWRAVMNKVRNLYQGPITYAVNWDNNNLAWWDTVDYIGIDAYNPLTDKVDPTVDELKAAWVPYVANLADLAARWNKPILFTEVGYRSQDGVNRAPWEWQLAGNVDLQEQADCYQALFESVFDQPWLAGIYLWSWATGREGGAYDQGYTPRDKPAENILRQWYGGKREGN